MRKNRILQLLSVDDIPYFVVTKKSTRFDIKKQMRIKTHFGVSRTIVAVYFCRNMATNQGNLELRDLPKNTRMLDTCGITVGLQSFNYKIKA